MGGTTEAVGRCRTTLRKQTATDRIRGLASLSVPQEPLPCRCGYFEKNGSTAASYDYLLARLYGY